MARKVTVQRTQTPGRPSAPVDPKAQDYLGMWGIFMVILGICLIARVPAWIGAVAGAILGGGLGQVLPVREDGKRLPMPATAGLIIAGLVFVLISFLIKK